MLCAVFSLCYVQVAVRTSSLRCEHASLRSGGKAQQGYKGRAQGNAEYQTLCAGPPFIVSVHETNEKVPYIYMYVYIHIYERCSLIIRHLGSEHTPGIYIHIHIHLHIYTHIYIHIYRSDGRADSGQTAGGRRTADNGRCWKDGGQTADGRRTSGGRRPDGE